MTLFVQNGGIMDAAGPIFYDLHPKPRTFFGRFENGKMVLQKTGEITITLRNDISKHQQIIELGDFVIMPNPIHGILIINKPTLVQNDFKISGKIPIHPWRNLIILPLPNTPIDWVSTWMAKIVSQTHDSQ